MSVLFGFGIGVASYPLLIRANALTDNTGLIAYEYKRNALNQWIPKDSTAPTLEFHIHSDYWEHFDVDERQTFELRHGGLGLTQINMVPIYEDQKNFYRNSRN